MDIVFVETAASRSVPESWNTDFNHDQFLTILRQAATRSAQLGSDVLASFTQPIAPYNPLHIFSVLEQLQLGERFFWGQPSQRSALVGVGAATTIETYGSSRFESAASSWHALQQSAVIGYLNRTPGETNGQIGGPILFGGFTFDPLNPRTQLWEGFPDGLLILPELLYSCKDGRATLTINKLVHTADDIEQYAATIAATIQQFYDAIEQVEFSAQEAHQQRPSISTHDLIAAPAWKEQVAHAVQMIRDGAYEKVVLARGIRATHEEGTFDIEATLLRLRDSYPGATIFAIQRGERYFLAATPERLILAQDGKLQTMALAGSAPRGATEEEDTRLGIELLNSAKNKGEHDIVVTTVHNALAAMCSKVWVADTPRLLRLKNIQHLETAIVGDLLPGHSILEALQVLHPTPAVGGYPRQPALEAIREQERLDRGWYASPVGWIGVNGNGEFAVALRSGLVEGNTATLFAGCGIVADSDPESEYEESCLKFQVMLRGLSGEE